MPIPFEQLETCDLIVDAVYCGGNFKDVRDDPLQKILPVGNQGGFRTYGSPRLPDCRLVVLYTSLSDPDWPDELDVYSGTFTYFGDNKKPGKQLHDTSRGGNELLSQVFEALHSGPEKRKAIPPFFVFSKAEDGRDVRFRGLAVPGGSELTSIQDLVAVWRAVKKHRFQNYRALFTILDTPKISRAWLKDLCSDALDSPYAPDAWAIWQKSGVYQPLTVEREIQQIRTKKEQLPESSQERQIVEAIYQRFCKDSHGFEHCAARLASMVDGNFGHVDVTRPWRDGGRDAVGTYRIGTKQEVVQVDWALEAKCYEKRGVGVEDVSRLISRLRYRQFGILVTTSYVSDQAYKEIKADGHPVLILAAKDIIEILARHGMNTPELVKQWLEKEFPLSALTAH